MIRETGDKISFRGDKNLHAGDCNGCAVCLLSCPVWKQSNDQILTFCGRMRAMQGGAGLEELAASVNSCTLCGSCEPVCSYGVESVMRTVDMRALLRADNSVSEPQGHRKAMATGRVLLANPMLIAEKGLLEKTLTVLDGVTLFEDNGDDISEAMETGRRIDISRISRFMLSLRGASEVIITDGLLYRLIRNLSPETRTVSLGEALLGVQKIVQQLGPEDMYIIDARAYNSDHIRLVGFYDNIFKMTGSLTNLDLHRVAIPTGVSLHSPSTVVDPVSQAEWILKGRSVDRIIVERLEDMAPFRSATDVPVVFLADLG